MSGEISPKGGSREFGGEEQNREMSWEESDGKSGSVQRECRVVKRVN